MYKIKLNNLKFRGHIGVLPEEKVLGQNLEVDLIVTTNFDFSGQDKLSDTLSYVDFYQAAQTVVENSRADLLEKVAYDLTEVIKNLDDRIDTVEVHLRKLAVPIDGLFDSAEIEMKR